MNIDYEEIDEDDGIFLGEKEFKMEFPYARCGHLGFMYHDKIWVWGGYGDLGEQNFMGEIYFDPNIIWNFNTLTEKWQLIDTSGSHPPPLSGAACAIFPEFHRVYIFGGFYKQSKNSIHLFDLTCHMWTEELPKSSIIPSYRDKHSMWPYRNKFYIFGGYGPSINEFTNDFGQFLKDETNVRAYGWNNQVFSYDIASHIWENIQTTGNVPSPRAAQAGAVVGDKLFLFGGRSGSQRLNDLYSLNLQNMIWTRIIIDGPIPEPRSWHSFTTVLNNPTGVVLFGGFSNDQRTLDDCWIFYTNLNAWSQQKVGKSLPKLWHSCRCTSEGEMVLFGGCVDNILSNKPRYTNQVDILNFSPKSLFWLCLREIYKHLSLLEPHYEDLPEHLRDRLLRSIGAE